MQRRSLVPRTESPPRTADALMKSLGMVSDDGRVANVPRERVYAAKGRGFFRWLLELLGILQPERFPSEAPALPPPDGVAEKVQQLVAVLALLGSDSLSRTEILQAVSKAKNLEAEINNGNEGDSRFAILEPSPDARFQRLTLRNLQFKSGGEQLDGLNLSGVRANVALRFENCRFDVLDISHAELYSIDLRGCRPADESAFFEWGMRIFAQELHLKADFVIGRWSEPSRVRMLDGTCMRAHKIELVGGTEFKGGDLAEHIWDEMIACLRGNVPQTSASGIDHCSNLSKREIIDVYSVAARDVLKTIALISAEANSLLIAVKAKGIIDVHDAYFRRFVFVDADKDHTISHIDFVAKAKNLDVDLAGGDCDALIRKAQYLSSPISPCLDMAGVKCDGEIRFDGPDEPAKPNEKLPVQGHINLDNARCRTYIDDGAWLDRANPRLGRWASLWRFAGRMLFGKSDAARRVLTFGLSSFHYDFFGQSPRLLFENDVEFEHEKWFQPSAANGGIGRQRRRRDALGNLEDSSFKFVNVNKNLIRDRVRWLEAASPDGEDQNLPENAQQEFDAQPWTHCARVLRQTGWRKEAEDILLTRETNLHKPRLAQSPILWIYFAAVFVLFFGVALWFQSDPPVTLNSCALVLAFLVIICWEAILRFFPDRKGKYPLAVAVWYSLLRITIGYGFKPSKAVSWSLALIAVGAFAFYWADKERLIIMNPAANDAGASMEDGEGPETGAVTSSKALQSATVSVTTGAPIGPSAASVQTDAAEECDYRDCGGDDREECARNPLRKKQCSGKPSGVTAPATEHARADSGAPTNEQSATCLGCVIQKMEVAEKAGGPYPRLNALMYSLDVFIPLIDFSQGSYWIPGIDKKRSVAPWKLCGGSAKIFGVEVPLCGYDVPPDGLLFLVSFVYWFMIAAGWWFTTILLASFTGLLDRKE